MTSAEEAAENLITTIIEDDLARLERLISSGTAINTHNINGTTPLSCAIDTGNTRAVETLLRFGADPLLPDGDGMTPLGLAAYVGTVAIAASLIRYGANVNQQSRGWSPVYWAAQESHVAMLRFLAEHGADLNPSNVDGTTPLSNAAAGQEAIVQELLTLGASARFRNSTALLIACAYGQTSIAALLIAAGADVNAVTSDGDTPLKFAREVGKARLVKLLLQSGARE